MALPFNVTVRSRAFSWRLRLTKALAYTPLQATGQQWFTLAFITADQERKVPAWAGTIGLEKQFLMDQVSYCSTRVYKRFVSRLAWIGMGRQSATYQAKPCLGQGQLETVDWVFRWTVAGLERLP